MAELIIPIQKGYDFTWLFKLLEQHQVRYHLSETEGVSLLTENDDVEEILSVRQRLHDKFVTTGIWNTMDDEERQDATLGETMLYRREQPDYGVLSEKETRDFINALKDGTFQ